MEIEGDPLYHRVCEAGRNLRLISRAEISGQPGVRASIQHEGYGEGRTILTSWEDDNGLITHQLLVFAGLAAEYSRSAGGIRTGTAEEIPAPGNGQPEIQIKIQDTPASRTLELASVLLREAHRDFYTQHLLQQVNDVLSHRLGRPQTQVFGLVRWRSRLRRASDRAARLRTRRLLFIVYLAAGVLIGGLATLLAIAFLA